MDKKQYQNLWNLKTALEKGEERKRLTAQLQELCGSVADAIAAQLSDDEILKVTDADGKNLGSLRKSSMSSNLGWEEYLHADTGAITTGATPGETFCQHGDFSCRVQVAEADDFLWFANRMPEIVRSLEEKHDSAIAALQSAFARLREVAEVYR